MPAKSRATRCVPSMVKQLLVWETDSGFVKVEMKALCKMMLDGRRTKRTKEISSSGVPRNSPFQFICGTRQENSSLSPTKFARRYTPKCKWTRRAEARRREGEKALAGRWLDRNRCGATPAWRTRGSLGLAKLRPCVASAAGSWQAWRRCLSSSAAAPYYWQ